MPEQRRIARNPCFLRGEIVLGDGVSTIECSILDISDSGMKVATDKASVLPARFVLKVPRRNFNEPVRVVRRGKDNVGVVYKGL